MIKFKPFPAVRPRPDVAAAVCAPPYDVLSTEEARASAGDNALSFLHVSKPEIDLPAEISPYDDRVYAKGRENFQRLLSQNALSPDARPCFYLYRQIMGNHSQTGFVGVVRCQDYLDGAVKRHELTRPDKETDRVRHIEALNAQTGPAFLAYRSNPGLDAILEQMSDRSPDIDFTADDAVRHSSWKIEGEDFLHQIEEAFAKLPALYVCDGHHRTAAATRVHQSRQKPSWSAYFLAVVFPHNRLQILPYHRVVRFPENLTFGQVRKELEAVFEFLPHSEPLPRQRRQIGLFLEGSWRQLAFRPERLSPDKDPAANLDVALLQRWVLEPLFGIRDPRTSNRIEFVGGIRGPSELEKRVGSAGRACAFSLYPTGIEELMEVADAGGLMPPKSTWFEPKLRDAMFCFMLE